MHLINSINSSSQTQTLKNKASSLLRNIKLDNIVKKEIIPVSEVEIKTIIMSLRPKNSTGYNGIPNKILKYCGHSISKPLTYIILH